MIRSPISDSSVVRLLRGSIKMKELCNGEEKELFKILLNSWFEYREYCKEQKIQYAKFGINTQVKLSSFVECEKGDKIFDEYARLSVDFLIFDIETMLPLCVIEYFGGKHYKENTDENRIENDGIEIRDLKKLMITYKTDIDLEIICDDELHNEEQLKQRLFSLFDYLQEKIDKLKQTQNSL